MSIQAIAGGIMEDDIEKIELLTDKLSELVLPSMHETWNIRHGNQQQVEAMLAAKGDVIRAMAKLDRVKGLYPVG
jgi:3-deoxy-D-manno-octulosonic acid (KDO) 8-phosphate synthase